VKKCSILSVNLKVGGLRKTYNFNKLQLCLSSGIDNELIQTQVDFLITRGTDSGSVG
jgi:hypothetical protein